MDDDGGPIKRTAPTALDDAGGPPTKEYEMPSKYPDIRVSTSRKATVSEKGDDSALPPVADEIAQDHALSVLKPRRPARTRRTDITRRITREFFSDDPVARFTHFVEKITESRRYADGSYEIDVNGYDAPVRVKREEDLLNPDKMSAAFFGVTGATLPISDLDSGMQKYLVHGLAKLIKKYAIDAHDDDIAGPVILVREAVHQLIGEFEAWMRQVDEVEAHRWEHVDVDAQLEYQEPGKFGDDRTAERRLRRFEAELDRGKRLTPALYEIPVPDRQLNWLRDERSEINRVISEWEEEHKAIFARAEEWKKAGMAVLPSQRDEIVTDVHRTRDQVLRSLPLDEAGIACLNEAAKPLGFKVDSHTHGTVYRVLGQLEQAIKERKADAQRFRLIMGPMLRRVSVKEFSDLHRAAALLSTDPGIFGWVEESFDATPFKERRTYFILAKRFRQWALRLGKLTKNLAKTHRLREAGLRVREDQFDISEASAKVLEKAGGFRPPTKNARGKQREHAWVVVVERL
jgi:hypothetical protein